jgi:hypothetical protein
MARDAAILGAGKPGATRPRTSLAQRTEAASKDPRGDPASDEIDHAPRRVQTLSINLLYFAKLKLEHQQT